MNLQDAQNELEQALALEGLAHEQLLAHMGQDEPAASRTRHLQAEIEAAARKVSLARVKCQAAAIRAELESRQVQDAAQTALEAQADEYRDRCAALLDDRRRIAAEGLIEWLAVELGSRTVPRGFAGNAQGWTGHLCRTTSLDIASEALGLVQARKTEA